MSARYALVQFCFLNIVTGMGETVLLGVQRDSASQAVLQTPAAFWSAVPLSSAAQVANATATAYQPVYDGAYPRVPGTQIDPRLAAWLALYPTGGV